MLSANTLFHFTYQLETLCKILQTGFRPSYCLERFTSSNTLSNCHIPMVCFCDIPLSQVHHHVNRYGKYGLGMEVDWGVEKDVNPVSYVSQYSSVYKMLNGMQSQFVFSLASQTLGGGYISIDPFGQQEATTKLAPFIYSTTLLQCYLKLYKGIDIYSGLVTKFYDEKEWRYIPPFSVFPNLNPLFLRLPAYNKPTETKDDFIIKICESYLNMTIEEAIAEGKKRLNSYFLTFNPVNIKYIIVNFENDRKVIIDSLKEKKDTYSEEAINRLSSRIITYEQIREDF